MEPKAKQALYTTFTAAAAAGTSYAMMQGNSLGVAIGVFFTVTAGVDALKYTVQNAVHDAHEHGPK